MLKGVEEELEQPGDKPAESQCEDAGENLETGHLFSQWPQLLLAHDNQVHYHWFTKFHLNIFTLALTLTYIQSASQLS